MTNNFITYRLIDRTKTGRNIDVIFSYAPKKRISTGTKKMSEAILFAEKHLTALGQAPTVFPLFSEYAKDFFTRTDINSLHYRDISFKKEKRLMWYSKQQDILNQFVMPYFKDYPINAISTLLIEKWLISLKGSRGQELAGGTKYKALCALKKVLDDAERDMYIQSNPAKLATVPSRKPVLERRPLTIYEQKALFPSTIEERIAVWSDLVYAAYFSVMYDTGFRPAEVAALKVEDVYRTGDKSLGVYTNHSICFETMQYQERVKTSGKGMESRVGLLTDITAELILKLIKDKDLKEGDFLFLVDHPHKDSWIKYVIANKKLRSVCTRLGLDSDISQYFLRHTYATYRRGNLDEVTLALSMGHSGGRVREDYDHRTASILLAQLEKEREKIFQGENKEEEIAPLNSKTL